jgi:hypothetical protein
MQVYQELHGMDFWSTYGQQMLKAAFIEGILQHP